MFSCLQILEAFLWFVLITLLNVTLIILTLSVSRLLNLLLRLVAFLLFLNPQCLASISRWITASSSWKRFCLFVCRALSSIMVICMLTAIRLILTFVKSLYLKLMDEFAQCYNVFPQLDINNTIDHRPEGDEKWFLENEKTVTQFCRKLAAERPLKDIRDEYNYPKKKGIKDECSRLLEASTMKSRRCFAIQRLMNAMRQAHADGWFIVFDALTLADARLEAFYGNPNALRDYFRDIGRMVLAAEGRKANDSHADCYQYFCVPEYGTANGRLHFHAVHFMRTLPTGSVDPNFGRRVRNRRQLNSLQNTWPYGYSMPIAVRYTQDAFSRSGWLWPVDAKGE